MANTPAKLATLLSEWSDIMKNSKPLSTQTSVATLLLLAALALPGCVAEAIEGDDQIHAAVHASDKYPITVKKGPQVLEVASNKGGLSAGQENAVRGFVHKAMQAGITPLTVERPSGGGNSARVASEIASVMVTEGVARSAVNFRVYKGGSTSPVRVSFISTYASTKPCGDWSQDLTETSDNTSYPNLGCAVQTNLAAMIVDPDTLVVPKTVTPKYSGSDVAAVFRSTSQVNNTTLLSNYKYSSSP